MRPTRIIGSYSKGSNSDHYSFHLALPPPHSAVTANDPHQTEPPEKLVHFLLVCFGHVTAATLL